MNLASKEKKLRDFLKTSSLTLSQLDELKKAPEISRHLSLVAIISRHQEHEGYKLANKEAENSSLVKDFLLLLALPTIP